MSRVAHPASLLAFPLSASSSASFPSSSSPASSPVSFQSSSSPSPSPSSSSWSGLSLAGLTLDSFSFDSFDPTGAPPHPEANPSGLRSDAEINAYALPEQLTEVERLLALLQSPHAIQRRSAATQLVRVLDGESKSDSGSSSSSASVRQLLDGVVRLLRELDEAEQNEVSEVVAECADRGFISQQACVEALLPTLLHYLTPAEWGLSNAAASSPSPTNASTASSPTSTSTFASPPSAAAVGACCGPQLGPCLHIVSHLLTAHPSLGPLLSALSAFAQKSADSIHSSSRLVAAQLIGVLASHLSAPSVSSLLPSFLPLCQDTSLDVRAAMSSSVCRLAEAVRGSAASLQSIVSELSELLRDEEFAVKQAALLSSVSLLPLLPAPLLSSSLLPVFRSYLSSPPRLLHATVARVLGVWCVSCASSLSSDARVVREFYRSSSVGGDNDVRYWCAYNMPALLSLLAVPASAASSSSSPTLFDVAFLSPLLTSFSHDPHPPVRLSLSHSLPVAAPLLLRLSSQHMKLLKDIVVTLLKDGEASVRANTLACIPNLLATPTAATAMASSPSSMSKGALAVLSVSPSAPSGVDAAVLTDVFRAMLAVEFSSLSYRHRMLYLESLYSLRLHFTSHDMHYLYYDRLTPLLFASLHASPPLPLLQLLLAFLCHFLSSLPSSQRRHDLLLRLLRLYSPTARSCYDRLVFVRLLDEMAKCFSRRWMKKHALPHALKLLQTESVREVRLRLLAVLAGSRSVLRTMDGKEREQFARWAQSLAADGDQHSVEAVAAFNQRRPFERGEKAVTADERLLDDEDDRRDREREEREDRLLRDEEELMEAMMRKEQVRERNVLLSSSGGSQTNTAVMLLMMKQKKEREKVASKESKDKEKEREREEKAEKAAAAAISSSSPHFTQLAPVTPQHSKSASAGKLTTGTVSKAGRVRGASDKGLASIAVEEKEREAAAGREHAVQREDEDRKERGRPRGYFPGLSPPSSTAVSTTAAALSASASPSLSSAALRSASPSSSASSPPLSVSKRSVPLLPSAGLHPMSRRYPSTAAAASPTGLSATAQSIPVSPTPAAASAASSPSSFIPLSHSGSPRLVKLSSAAGKHNRVSNHNNATLTTAAAAAGGGSGRRT